MLDDCEDVVLKHTRGHYVDFHQTLTMRDWLSCCVQRGDGIQYPEMLNVMYTRHDYIDKRERSREYHKYTLKERYCCTGPPSNATTLLTVLSWPEDCSD